MAFVTQCTLRVFGLVVVKNTEPSLDEMLKAMREAARA
jgi:hypothetical protein